MEVGIPNLHLFRNLNYTVKQAPLDLLSVCLCLASKGGSRGGSGGHIPPCDTWSQVWDVSQTSKKKSWIHAWAFLLYLPDNLTSGFLFTFNLNGTTGISFLNVPRKVCLNVACSDAQVVTLQCDIWFITMSLATLHESIAVLCQVAPLVLLKWLI